MMEWLIEHWDEIGTIVAALITAASVIVRLTPTPKDNEVLKKIRRILEKLALTPPERKS